MCYIEQTLSCIFLKNKTAFRYNFMRIILEFTPIRPLRGCFAHEYDDLKLQFSNTFTQKKANFSLSVNFERSDLQ